MTEKKLELFLIDIISKHLEQGCLTMCMPISEYYIYSGCSGLAIRLKNGNQFVLPLIKIFGGYKKE